MPARVAVPVTATWPNRPLAGVPPIWTLSVPAEVCVKLPATVSVLPAPTVRLPLLVKSPAVVKLAPLVTAEAAAVGGQAGEAGDRRPGAVEGDVGGVGGDGSCRWGTASVAPSSAFQVPPVSVLPESWLTELASRYSVPESASMVPVLLSGPLIEQRRGAGAGGLADRAGVVDGGLPAERVVDAGIGLDQVRGPRLVLQRGGRDVVAVQAEVAGAGLDDRPVIVERAVFEEALVAGAGEVHRSQVGDVPREPKMAPPVHWNMLPGKFSVSSTRCPSASRCRR